MNRPWLYRGRVGHTRLQPRLHHFSYPALFICFPLARKAELRSRLFSLDRFNLFSYHQADHGDGGDGEAWVRGVLAQHAIALDGSIWLQTMPRMLGFVFNPVSFWLCHDREDRLRAVICEVNNTFGERHCYLLTAPGLAEIGPQAVLSARKVFHVSPFFSTDGEYRFRFRHSAARRQVGIDYWEHGAPVLRTAIAGDARPLTDRELLRLFFSLGWATLLVVLRIHWQALRLWLKGNRFHSKPLPPAKEITR